MIKQVIDHLGMHLRHRNHKENYLPFIFGALELPEQLASLFPFLQVFSFM